MTWKSLILSSLWKLRYFDVLRHLQSRRVGILMYHRFSEKPEPFKTAQSVFEKQIRLISRKYRFIGLRDYCLALHEDYGRLPANSIVLTIDDGYEDNYVFAYPILKKYSIPATIFVTTDFVSHRRWLWSDMLQYILWHSKDKEFDFVLGKDAIRFSVGTFGSWHQSQLRIFNFCRALPNDGKETLLRQLADRVVVKVPEEADHDYLPLTWDQIREMKKHGVDFGSHSCSHPILSKVSQSQLEREIAESKREIEKETDSEVRSFCYPNGQMEDFDARAVEVLKKSGYSSAVTTVSGSNRADDQDPFMLRRVSIADADEIRVARRLTCL